MFYEFHHLDSPDYWMIHKGTDLDFPLHLHQCFELIVILSGEMRVTVDSTLFSATKNEAVLILPNQIHALHSAGSEHLICVFAPNLVQKYATRVSGKTPKNSVFVPEPYLVNALDRLGTDATAIEKKGILYSLCGQFDKAADYEVRQAGSETLLHTIFSFVETEFDGDCSLSALAKKTGYDYSYLSSFFKKSVGIPFNTYVNHYRLSRACYLMENTSSPILQCAMESGYTSLRSFNRNFKARFHQNPAQYRKNATQ